MADKSKIQWCDATINPCYGCSPVSPACANCYAAKMAARMAHNPAVCQYFEGLTDKNNKWTGRINLFPQKMEQALRWKRPRRIFVGSMTDIFHEAVPDSFLDQIFTDMALAQHHTFILLTKRPERMRHYIQGVHDEPVDTERDMALFDPWRATGGELYGQRPWPLPNVILMTTVEDQPRADGRMPHLMALASMGWLTGVSVEPMLGQVDLNRIHESGESEHGMHWESWESCLTGRRFDIWADRESEGYPRLSWVICGGESGPGARPMHPDWVRGLRDQCKAAGTPFLFKQWGEWGTNWTDMRGDVPVFKQFSSFEHYCAKAPTWMYKGDKLICPDGHVPTSGCREGKSFPMAIISRVGNKRAGRLLDGRDHNEFPK
ncbi:phage Gp37/Gp68 family protein [Solidesulfovibrio sp.]